MIRQDEVYHKYLIIASNYSRNIEKYLILSIVSLAFSQFFDILSTKYLLSTGYFIEYNPIMDYIFKNYCYEVGLILKLSLVYWIWSNINEIKSILTKGLLFVAAISYIILNIYQTHSIISVTLTNLMYQ